MSTRVIVTLRNGAVERVFSDDHALDVEVLDYDDRDESRGPAAHRRRLEAECQSLHDVTERICPHGCGNRLQHFMHHCPESSDHPEIFGCPACDDDCPQCSQPAEH